MEQNALRWILKKQKAGLPVGVASVCSANEYVLRAALRSAGRNGHTALIEATANQVNPEGGYTGMRPADFRDYVYRLADEEGVPREQILLGGDHLGPLTYRKLPAEEAMQKSEQLVSAYVEAGFRKIHLDTSMPIGDDAESGVFGETLIAQRSARLAAVCEKARPQGADLCYVVGSEVPIPGGSFEEECLVGSAESFTRQYAAFADAYARADVDFSSVVGFVVQPGVEFSNISVRAYDRAQATAICEAGRRSPVVLEGHSTDYQTREQLRQLVEDGVAILKVGPALTFAAREGLYALEHIADELGVPTVGFRRTLIAAMRQDDRYWKSYYTGSDSEIAYQLSYGLSDRCRYYLSRTDVHQAAEQLLDALSNVHIPYALLRQYLPVQAENRKNGALSGANARTLLYDKIEETLDDYRFAVMERTERMRRITRP